MHEKALNLHKPKYANISVTRLVCKKRMSDLESAQKTGSGSTKNGLETKTLFHSVILKHDGQF